jgi:uncharacterized protein (UPF0276 family)
MEFSINYSRPAAALVRDGRIHVDRFKCTEWPDMIAPARELLPVYVHFPTNAGTGEVPDVDAIQRVARETDTPLLNVHLVARGQDWPGADVNGPGFAAAVADRLERDVAAITDRVGAERVIAENLIYTGPGSEYLRPAIEPHVIRTVLDRTGCGLLLDISHARIAAKYLGVDWKDYLAQLPLERMRELHVTGLAQVDGVLTDHEPLTEQDWADVEWAMERIRQGDWPEPWMVALEYGGVGGPYLRRSDSKVIEEQVPRLRDLVERAAKPPRKRGG